MLVRGCSYLITNYPENHLVLLVKALRLIEVILDQAVDIFLSSLLVSETYNRETPYPHLSKALWRPVDCHRHIVPTTPRPSRLAWWFWYLGFHHLIHVIIGIRG